MWVDIFKIGITPILVAVLLYLLKRDNTKKEVSNEKRFTTLEIGIKNIGAEIVRENKDFLNKFDTRMTESEKQNGIEHKLVLDKITINTTHIDSIGKKGIAQLEEFEARSKLQITELEESSNQKDNLIMERFHRHEMVLSKRLRVVEASVSEDVNIKVFSNKLLVIIEEAVKDVKDDGSRLKLTLYLRVLKSVIIENVEEHMTKDMEYLDNEAGEYQAGLARCRTSFSELFGEEHVTDHYQDLEHFDAFLKNIKEIQTLQANSKKARYLNACKELMHRSTARAIHYVVANVKPETIKRRKDDV